VPADEFDFSQTQPQAMLSTNSSPGASRLLRQVRQQYPAMPVLGIDGIHPAPVLAVTRVLRSLDALMAVDSAEAFCLLPVAMAGKAGIEELANQSRSLFNLERPEPDVFPLQIAFNLMPYGAGADAAGFEARMAGAGTGGDAQVGFSVAWAPIFYGAAIALHVLAKDAVDESVLRKALGHADGIILMDTGLAGGIPTPATDAADSDDVFLGQVRVDGKRARFWLVCDPLRLEAAQFVSAVENWIEKPANSVLT
jgi:aspartate-semialdehyde dehydrogenase